MWLIENDGDFKTGGFVEWNKPYKLKHFITGKYLSVYITNKGP